MHSRHALAKAASGFEGDLRQLVLKTHMVEGGGGVLGTTDRSLGDLADTGRLLRGALPADEWAHRVDTDKGMRILYGNAPALVHGDVGTLAKLADTLSSLSSKRCVGWERVSRRALSLHVRGVGDGVSSRMCSGSTPRAPTCAPGGGVQEDWDVPAVLRPPDDARVVYGPL